MEMNDSLNIFINFWSLSVIILLIGVTLYLNVELIIILRTKVRMSDGKFLFKEMQSRLRVGIVVGIDEEKDPLDRGLEHVTDKILTVTRALKMG